MSKLTLEQIKHLSTICEKTISVYPSDDYEVSEKPVNQENFFHLEHSEYTQIGRAHIFVSVGEDCITHIMYQKTDPLTEQMKPGLYQASWHDDGTCTVEMIVSTIGLVIPNRYQRKGYVTLLREEITEDAAYNQFIVDEAPSSEFNSKDGVIACLLELMKLNEDQYSITRKNLQEAFVKL